MNFDKASMQGKWNEIKGELRKAWGRLTDDELEQTKGDVTAIKGLLEQRYSDEKQDFNSRLDEIYSRFKSGKEEAVDSVKQNLERH